ncbi:cupredoxin domain-containing protein [Rhodococcus sp. NPDC003318]|uniref:cupredoxin domain-containing protein n=1 Tax=Rhodococcus sp. NPDC003318 TaxID=3364503 RepID=UPI0036C071C0
MKTGKLAAGIAGLTLGVGLVTGCDSDNEPTTPEAPQMSMVNPSDDHEGTHDEGEASTPAGEASVLVRDFAFTSPVTVRAGAEVSIDNQDGVEHSVTSDTAGAFDEDVDGNSTATFRAPTTPGTYPFHCRYHPEMTGTLVVQ